MADEGELKLGNVIVNIDGTDDLEKVAKTFNNILGGTEINKYLSTQEDLLNRLTSAMSAFDRIQNRSNAGELLNTVNALKAVSGENFSSIISDIDRLNITLEQARGIYGTAFTPGMSVENFTDAIKSLELMKKSGLDVENVIEKLSEPGAESLLRQIRVLNAALIESRQEADELRRKLAETENSEFVENLRHQLKSFIYESQAEFKTFLDASDMYAFADNNFSPNGNYILNEYLEKIADDSLTAKQAISLFKAEYKDFFPESNESNVSNMELQEFVDRITLACEKVEELATALADAKTVANGGGALDLTAQNLARSTELTDAERAAMESLVKEGANIENVTQILGALINAGGEAQHEMDGVYSSIGNVIKELNGMGNLDVGNINALAQVLKNLGYLSNVKINPVQVANLASSISSLANIPKLDSLMPLTAVNLSGFSGLSIREASLRNLATYLPTISNANIGNLAALGKIDFTNLQNLRVTRATARNMLDLADVSQQLTDINAKLTSLGGAVDTTGGNAAGVMQNVASATGEAATAMNNAATAAAAVSGTIGAISFGNSGAGIARIAESLTNMGVDSGIAGQISQAFDGLNVNITKVKANWDDFTSGSVNTTKVVIDAVDSMGNAIRRTMDFKLGKTDKGEKFWYAQNSGSATIDYEKQAAAAAKLTMTQEQLAGALEKVNSAEVRAREAYSKAYNVGVESDQMNSLEAYLNTLSELKGRLQAGTIGNEEFSRSFNIVSSYIKIAINDINAQSEAAAKLVMTETQLAQALKKVNTAELKANTAFNTASTLGINTTQVTELQGYIAELATLKTRVNDGTIGNDEFGESFRRLSSYINIAVQSLNGQIASAKSLRMTDEQATNAGVAISDLQTKIEKMVATANSSGIALDGTISDQITLLNDISTMLSYLDEEVKKGTLTNTQFAQSFAEIAADAKLAMNDMSAVAGVTGKNPMLTYNQMLEQSVRTALTSAGRAGVQSGDISALESYNSQLKENDILFKNNNITLEEYTDRIRKIGTEVEPLIEKLRRFSDIAGVFGGGGADISKNVAQADTMLSKLSSAYTKLTNLQVPKSPDNSLPKDIQSRINKIEEYRTQIENLKQTLQTNSDNEMFEAGFETTSNMIQSLIAEINTLAGQYNNILTPGTEKYDTAQSNLNAKIQAAQRFLENNTAAQYSNNRASRDAYTKIGENINAYKKLGDELKDGKISQADYDARMKALNGSIKENSEIIKTAGDNHKTFGDRLTDAAKKFSYWFSATRLVMAAYREIKKMVSTVIELDTAMTELRKVTDETSERYNRFLEGASEKAVRLGASMTDVVNATADFARLGFSIDEAEQLSEAALVYKNVGDGIDNISEASESIISTMKAFGMSAEEAMSIVDRFNEVGNNFAISSEGVGQALQRSSAALHAANNTIEESIGLVTAANTIVQNPESVGTAMKTLSMYLRAAKTEAEDAGESTEGMASSVSTLRKEILRLTGNKVDIMLDEDTFKSTYQIMKELSGVWGDLSDVSQANVTKLVAGKRNANVVAAILENFDIAEEAMAKASDAEGSAITENEKFLASAQGKIEQLKAMFQQFSEDFIGSEFVKQILDIALNMMPIINGISGIIDKMGGLNTVLTVTAAIIAAAKADAIVLFLINTASKLALIPSKIMAITAAVQQSALTLKSLPALFKLMTATGTSAGNALKTILTTSTGGGVTPAGLAIGAITAAISIAIIAIQKYKQRQEELARQAVENGRKAADESKEIISLTNAYLELSEAEAKNATKSDKLLDARQAIIDKLDIEKSKLNELIRKYGSYEKAITAASLTELKSNWKDQQGGVTQLGEDLVKAAKENQYILSGATEAVYNMAKKAGLHVSKSEIMKDAPGDYLGTTKKIGTGNYNYYVSTQFNGDTPEGALQTYKELDNFLNILTGHGLQNSEVFQKVYEKYSALKPTVESYKDSVSDLNTNLVEQNLLTELEGRTIPKTRNEFNNFRNGLVASVTASGKFVNAGESVLDVVNGILSKEAQFAGFYNTAENITNVMNPDGRAKETSDIVSEINALEKLKTNLKSAIAEADRLGKSKTAEDFANQIAEADARIKELKGDLNDINSSVYDNAADLGEGLDLLSAVYKDIKDGVTFDYSSIFGNSKDGKKFAETFSSLDSYSEFINTVAESPKDIKKCQDAFNKLTTEFIATSGALDDLSGAQRNGMVALLKQMGVANAASVVDRQIIENNTELKDALFNVTEETRKETVALLESNGVKTAAAIVDEQIARNKEILRIKTVDYKDATLAEIKAAYNEAEAGSVLQQALAQILVEKINLQNHQINTASDIQQLINLANAAGAAAVPISRLQALMEVMNGASFDGSGHYKGMTEQQYIRLLNDIQSGKYDLKYTPMSTAQYTSGVTFTGGSSTGSTGSGSSGSTKKEETWFEKQYKLHKHLVAMQEETDRQYLDWLTGAYHKAMDEGILELDDYRKYQEEVFKGYQELFEKGLGNLEFEIDMRDGRDRSKKEILGIYDRLIKEVEKELAAARARGLDNTSEYIQNLLSKWQGYVKDRKDIEDEVTNASMEAIDKLAEYRIDMIKQEIEDEKDKLDKRLDYLKEFYDKQKELLQDAADEEKYLEDQKEKRKSVTDIQSQLRQLEKDNSAWAAKRRAELKAELEEAEKELKDFEKDHSLDVTLDFIDKTYEAQEKRINDQMEALDKRLNDPKALYNQALADIRENSKKQLYLQMLQYNREHGDGKDATVRDLWNETYGALDEFFATFGSHFEAIVLENAGGYKPGVAWNNETVSGNKGAAGNSNNNNDPIEGSVITVKKTATNFSSRSGGGKLASNVPGGYYTVYGVDGDQILIGANGSYLGWIKKSDIVGYASGTRNAGAGLHAIDEEGSETIFESKNGSKYKMFTGGEKVLNARASNFLYEFANSGGHILEKIIRGIIGDNPTNRIDRVVSNTEIRTGDIVINGNADEKTVSEIRRAQRNEVDFILREFSKLKA